MGAKNWSPEEDQCLREFVASGRSVPDCLHLFPGRSENGIRGRIERLGLDYIDPRIWSDIELQRIDEVIASGKTVKACMHLFPNRTDIAVKRKMEVLGKRKPRGHYSWVWDAIVRELEKEPGLTGQTLVKRIGCCHRQVMDRLYEHQQNGVHVSGWVRSGQGGRGPGPWIQQWTLGNTKDAKKPTTQTVEQRRMRDRMAYQRSMRRINPFTTLTNPVVPKGQPGRVIRNLRDDESEMEAAA